MQRRRAAVLYADAVGYSRLTELDEDGTHESLRTLRNIWLDIIQAHEGRIVNYAGDALMAEMPNAARALRCAAVAQRTIKQRNIDVPVDRRLRFRVGINTGSVIVDGEDIFGDGVNIAARLASRADAGGICISDAEFVRIEPPEDLGFEFLGALKVRNITKPVGAFKVLMRPEHAGKILGKKQTRSSQSPWVMAAGASIVLVAAAIGLSSWYHHAAPELGTAAGHSATSVFEKPSITVLSFENLTGDPEQRYLAESISDGIFLALSKFTNLSVSPPWQIGGRTADTAAPSMQTVENAGVRYLLEGTVRRSADRLYQTSEFLTLNLGFHDFTDVILLTN